jgi:hypothetical protein
MKHGWTDGAKKCWGQLFVCAIVLLFLPRSLNILFRIMYFMNLILKTKYTLSTEFVLARQQPLAYQSGTIKNLELLHPEYVLFTSRSAARGDVGPFPGGSLRIQVRL